MIEGGALGLRELPLAGLEGEVIGGLDQAGSDRCAPGGVCTCTGQRVADRRELVGHGPTYGLLGLGVVQLLVGE
jgi:hypothetical protein